MSTEKQNSETIISQLKERIENRTAAVAVIGLGYVGLPLAVEKAKVGFRVLGVDQNPKRVDMLNRGENYIDDVKDEELKDIVEKGLLT
ncbi:MAG: NAD(P)-binding domain-containing protein, partial [Thermacetogeniaceae bacterium]